MSEEQKNRQDEQEQPAAPQRGPNTPADCWAGRGRVPHPPPLQPYPNPVFRVRIFALYSRFLMIRQKADAVGSLFGSLRLGFF